MKNFLFLLLFSFFTSYSQDLTLDDFRSLVPSLEKQDFKNAFEQSKVLLQRTKSSETDAHAQISYANIFSAAGMVATSQMSLKDFEENLKGFVGKKIMMPARPFVSDTVKVAFNSFALLRDKDQLRGFSMTANQTKTNILLFEYFKFMQAPDPKELMGQNVQTSGILESFDVNSGASKTWVARLHFSGAAVKTLTRK